MTRAAAAWPRAADGRPKPAQDIWNRQLEAGVPRHAEIVCIGDTRGEAAANDLLFKRTGFAGAEVAALCRLARLRFAPARDRTPRRVTSR
jgi:hypothetical protein